MSLPSTRYASWRFGKAQCAFTNARVWCQISSAVSTVLDAQKSATTDAAEAEHCGYGDLY
jgi:hypothetical protein